MLNKIVQHAMVLEFLKKDINCNVDLQTSSHFGFYAISLVAACSWEVFLGFQQQ